MRTWILLSSLAASACAAVPRDGPPPPPPTAGMIQTIRYATGACFGACPVYVLTVRSDGSGTFEGHQHTAVAGTREFTVTPQQYAEFLARIEPYLPEDGERRLSTGPECNGRVATDLPSVDIVVTQKGPQQHLYVYFGCDMESNAPLFEALRRAPEALPQVEPMIGRR